MMTDKKELKRVKNILYQAHFKLNMGLNEYNDEYKNRMKDLRNNNPEYYKEQNVKHNKVYYAENKNEINRKRREKRKNIKPNIEKKIIVKKYTDNMVDTMFKETLFNIPKQNLKRGYSTNANAIKIRRKRENI